MTNISELSYLFCISLDSFILHYLSNNFYLRNELWNIHWFHLNQKLAVIKFYVARFTAMFYKTIYYIDLFCMLYICAESDSLKCGQKPEVLESFSYLLLLSQSVWRNLSILKILLLTWSQFQCIEFTHYSHVILVFAWKFLSSHS